LVLALAQFDGFGQDPLAKSETEENEIQIRKLSFCREPGSSK